MIDTPTAWSILCTPLVIAAGLGWIRCARMLKIARDGAAHWKQSYDRAKANEQGIRSALGNSQDASTYYCRQMRDAIDRATDLEDQLRRIERQRSDTTRKGNLTKAAKRKALLDATTAAVARANAAASSRPAERLAA